MDFLQIVFSELREVLPICLMISISILWIYFSIRFLKNMFILQGYSYFSNPFEDISEKIQDIEKEEIVTADTDKPYKINLSKDKSGGQADLYKKF